MLNIKKKTDIIKTVKNDELEKIIEDNKKNLPGQQ